MKTKNSDAMPAPEFSFITETSALARETLKLLYSAKRLFRFLACANEVNNQGDICCYADKSCAIACSPSA